MSRSYKRTGAQSWCGGSDKPARTRYHRDERRKVKRLLKEQEQYGTSVWEPVKGLCEIHGDMCHINHFWCSDPSEYIIDYDERSFCVRYDYHFDCFICGWTYYTPEGDLVGPEEEPWEKIILNKIDYSLPSADRYCWPSDGGIFWREDISVLRKQFDRDVFGNVDCKGSVRYSNHDYRPIWEDYIRYRETVQNMQHRKYVVRFYYNKIDGESTFKQILVDKHPLRLKFDRDGWTRMTFWKERGYSNPTNDYWLLSFLFHRNVIPMTFTSSDELIDWLRTNEEKILKLWFKIKYKK